MRLETDRPATAKYERLVDQQVRRIAPRYVAAHREIGIDEQDVENVVLVRHRARAGQIISVHGLAGDDREPDRFGNLRRQVLAFDP